MSQADLDTLTPLLPLDFFDVKVLLKQVDKTQKLGKKHVLPKFYDLIGESFGSECLMGWDLKGLSFSFIVETAPSLSLLPEYRKGDSIELFIDTRDLKTSGITTKFCHHFVFFPQKVDDIFGLEVTSFRTEDRHELCGHELLDVQAQVKQNSYHLEIFIPSECLYGYDPHSFGRLGFTYRINRKAKEPEHFVLSSNYWAIEHQPMLFATLEMEKE